MTDESGQVVRIERTFGAMAEEVFDAWTSPEVMRRWFHCGPDWDTPEADVDLRVGGKVRVVMRRPDGTEVEAHGEYTLIDRPRRLVMTWTFDDDPSNEQLIELSFSESEGRVQPDAVAARPLGRAGCDGARRPYGPHGHGYDPRLRHTKGLCGVGRASDLRRSGERGGGHLPGSHVGVPGGELARRRGQGVRAPECGARTGRADCGMSKGRDTVQLRHDQRVGQAVVNYRTDASPSGNWTLAGPASRFGAMAGARTAATAAAPAATLGLTAASWVVTVRGMNGMDMGSRPGSVRSGPLSACGCG